MTEDRKHSDERFEANLRNLAKQTPRPVDPTMDQVDRWVRIAQSQHAAKPNVVARFFCWKPWRSGAWAAAAAAVVLIVTVFAFRAATPKEVSAEDLFSQVRSAVAKAPTVQLRIQNFHHSGHVLNANIYAADQGEAFFGTIRIGATNPQTPTQVSANMRIGRNRRLGWVFVQELQCNGNPLLEGLLPSDGGLLVRYPVSVGADQAMRETFPMMFRLESFGPVIESLENAMTNLQVVRRDGGIVTFSGNVSNPSAIDLDALEQALDVVHMPRRITHSPDADQDPAESVRSIKHAARMAKKALSLKLDPQGRQEAFKHIDLFTEIAIAKILKQHSPEAQKTYRRHERSLRDQLREKLAGSRIELTYDSKRKALTTVRLEDIGQAGSVVSIRLMDTDIDRSRLDVERIARQKNVRSVYRDELLMYMLIPSLLKDQLNNSANSLLSE